MIDMTHGEIEMTTSPYPTVTDELIAELEAAADAATPQDLDSAEEAIKADPDAMIECPVCGGEGYASVENDYCNFDNHAIGVQFYGIGPEFGAAESYYRRANPATIKALLAHIVDLKQQLVAAGITAENCEAFRVDAERWRCARDLMHPDDIRGFQDARDSFGMRPTENISAQCDAAIDAARQS